MFLIAVALWSVGYALAYTGATKLGTRGGAPSLLYNLGISNDGTPGKVMGASYSGGGAPTVIPAGTTPVAPAMPSPTSDRNPVRVA